jgi:oxygen-independent coproporphyrinogen-3 oxidase
MGVGVAAHSYLNGHRTANTQSVDKYLAAFLNKSQTVQESDEEINPKLQLAEAVILGLRLCDGICLDDIQSRFSIALPEYYGQCVEELIGFGLLERCDRRIKLTRRGRLLSNEVLWRFLPD